MLSIFRCNLNRRFFYFKMRRRGLFVFLGYFWGFGIFEIRLCLMWYFGWTFYSVRSRVIEYLVRRMIWVYVLVV